MITDRPPSLAPVCDPRESALKSFFLGPQAENAAWVRDMIQSLFDEWIEWRRLQFPEDGRAISKQDMCSDEFINRQLRFRGLLQTMALRFKKEVPKFSPRYIGHMFSEISLPALMGHIICLMHNPNNISSDSSRVGIQIEKEAIGFLADMIGFDKETAMGHFTSGGTVSNYEALWRARYHLSKFLKLENTSELFFKKPVILAPFSAHYSWAKGVELIGLPAESLWKVPLDERGKISISHISALIEKAVSENRPIMMVVTIAGTTELGTIDEIEKVQELIVELRKKFLIPLWHHVDAAYGGFFVLVKNELTQQNQVSLSGISTVDSVTLDPHKLGYVPYSSGAFLCRNQNLYQISTPKAPYVFDEHQEGPGLFTLEGSRSAAGATATWLTAETIGLHQDGYGKILERTIKSRSQLESKIMKDLTSVRVAPFLDTNILGMVVGQKGQNLKSVNEQTWNAWKIFQKRENPKIFISKTILSIESYEKYIKNFVASWEGSFDDHVLILLRICIMNPFFNTKESKVSYQDLVIEDLRQITHSILH